MTNINTVLFDLDGTLLNSLDDLADSVNYALHECGFPARSLEEIRSFVGNGVTLLIARAVPAETSDEAAQHCLQIMKDRYQQNMYNKTCPYDGIITLLTSLKNHGIQLAVISNKFDSAVKELCARWFADWIELAVGESESVAKKPSPTGVLIALKELNSHPQNALYIGDSEVDIATAQNAGVRSVGVTWGFRNRDVLKTAGADFIIDTPAELLDLLNIKSAH